MAQRLREVARGLGVLSASPPSRALHRRWISVAPGERERALLEEDPALKHFKSTKETVHRVKRFGDVLAIIVCAGCIYQLYDVAMRKRAERLGKSQS